MQGKEEYKPHHSKPLVSYTLCFISIQMCKGKPTDGSSNICLLVTLLVADIGEMSPSCWLDVSCTSLLETQFASWLLAGPFAKSGVKPK